MALSSASFTVLSLSVFFFRFWHMWVSGCGNKKKKFDDYILNIAIIIITLTTNKMLLLYFYVCSPYV